MHTVRRPEYFSRKFLALCAALTAFSIPVSIPARAQDAAPDPAKLKSLERDLRQIQSERDKLQNQTAASARALEAIRADTITTAKEIQDQEHSLTLLETRVAELETDSQRLTKALGRRDVQMVEVLLAIERLALRPTDALTLSPLSPSDAVRSAILLRSALPNIRQSSVNLQGELKDLYRVRTDLVTHKEQAAAGAAALLEKHKRLDALVREKADKHETLLALGQDINQRMTRMAQEAADLRALFAKLAEEKTRREASERQQAERQQAEREKQQKLAAQPAPQPATQPGITPVPKPGPSADKPGNKPAERQMASLPPSSRPGNEEAVTRSFAKARGTLPFPVEGKLASRYGEASQTAGEAGLLAKGITITARAGAQVVAPFDGIVAFAGPFRGYGQLLIIEHSEGYHTLLAGMGRIDGVVGQRVLAGEPIGVMEDSGAPSLYVELRRDGQPINPLPWLASRAGKNNG